MTPDDQQYTRQHRHVLQTPDGRQHIRLHRQRSTDVRLTTTPTMAHTARITRNLYQTAVNVLYRFQRPDTRLHQRLSTDARRPITHSTTPTTLQCRGTADIRSTVQTTFHTDDTTDNSIDDIENVPRTPKDLQFTQEKTVGRERSVQDIEKQRVESYHRNVYDESKPQKIEEIFQQ